MDKSTFSYESLSDHRFNQAVINSMFHQIAIIDQNGRIMKTNQSWGEFCLSNKGNPEKCGEGSNYFHVADPDTIKGIKAVLAGEQKQFSKEYPCHSPKEKRWFAMVVTPFIVDKEGNLIEGAVVSHINITDRKILELNHQRDLELAKSIQQSVLMPPIKEKGIAIEGLYLPSQQLSGDMYAWYRVDKYHYGVILLDIMGHGVSSSLISMSIRSLLQGIITRVVEPVEVYKELNKHFYSLFRTEKSSKVFFCTGIYMLINTEEKSIQYFNAGHPSGIVMGFKDRQFLSKTAVPIGLKENPDIACDVLHYSHQDRVILYTDGLADSLHMQMSECEDFIIRERNAKLRSLQPDPLTLMLEDNLEQVDDITIVSIQF